jgi:peptidoglycan hydrolase CwlO-like protein
MGFREALASARIIVLLVIVAVTFLPHTSAAQETAVADREAHPAQSLDARVRHLESEISRLQAQIADQQKRLDDWLPFKRDAQPSGMVPQ